MSRPAESPLPVAIVIVTWNSAGYIGDCLSSIAQLERMPESIVVVDNASADGTVPAIRDSPLAADLLELSDNTGFCHAANVGIARATSPFVLVLNPDTRLSRRFLEEVMPAFDDPRIGLATGKLRRFDGFTIDSAGQALARSRQPIDRGYGQRDAGQYDRDEIVFGVCGAAALYRRKMIEDISRPNGEFYDEGFFAFYEDLDVAWRARRRGWLAAYRHRGLAFHARGGTASNPRVRNRGAAFLTRSPMLRYHIAKNRYLTILRNDRLADYLSNLPFILARDAAMIAILLARSPSTFAKIWKGRAGFRRALELRAADHHDSAPMT